MCLKVKKDCKIETAIKNILVFKLVDKAEKPENWIAPIFRTEHEFDKKLTACEHLKINFEDYAGPNGGNVVHQGFHAYIEENENLSLNYTIIPSGSEYCYGSEGDIVSNQIIVFSGKEKLDKYLKES